jgi:aryl-alcohol dehydrogenase-like predicted oxidoreductase
MFKEHGLGTTIWSPLASGLLSGKYTSGEVKDTRLDLKGMEWLKESVLGEAKLDKAKKLQVLADEMGVPLAKLSLAWCLTNPNVSTVILGASKTEQLQQNLTALEIVPLLSPEVLLKIEDIMQTKPVLPQF